MVRADELRKEVGDVLHCANCGREIDSKNCYDLILNHRTHPKDSAFPHNTQAAGIYLCLACGLDMREFIYAIKEGGTRKNVKQVED